MRKLRASGQALKALMSALLVLILLAAAFAGLGLRSEAADDYRLVVQDDADLFSDAEEAKLVSELSRYVEYGNMAVVTLPEGNSYGGAERAAEQLTWEWFQDVDGATFVIDMETRYLYLYTYGSLMKIISVSDCDSITDNVYRQASRGDYYGCASDVMAQVYKLVTGHQIARPMMIMLTVLISLFLGAFIMYLIMKGTMKIPAASSYELSAAARTAFIGGEVQTVKGATTTIYSPLPKATYSSGGGSSGGGFSGGGGGFSGGGGGGGGGSFGGGGGHGGGHGF